MQSQRRLSRDATKNLGLKQSTENKKTIERVQKSAVAVILDSDYENYEHGPSVLALQCLDIRRKKLCVPLLPGEQQSTHNIATSSRRTMLT